MSNNGSYQKKYDGATGTYQEIEDANGNGQSSYGPGKKKWMIAVAALAVVAVGVYYGTAPSKNPAMEVSKTISKSGTLSVKSNGKLKLFDSLSKLVVVVVVAVILDSPL